MEEKASSHFKFTSSDLDSKAVDSRLSVNLEAEDFAAPFSNRTVIYHPSGDGYSPDSDRDAQPSGRESPKSPTLLHYTLILLALFCSSLFIVIGGIFYAIILGGSGTPAVIESYGLDEINIDYNTLLTFYIFLRLALVMVTGVLLYWRSFNFLHNMKRSRTLSNAIHPKHPIGQWLFYLIVLLLFVVIVGVVTLYLHLLDRWYVLRQQTSYFICTLAFQELYIEVCILIDCIMKWFLNTSLMDDKWASMLMYSIYTLIECVLGRDYLLRSNQHVCGRITNGSYDTKMDPDAPTKSDYDAILCGTLDTSYLIFYVLSAIFIGVSVIALVSKRSKAKFAEVISQVWDIDEHTMISMDPVHPVHPVHPDKSNVESRESDDNAYSRYSQYTSKKWRQMTHVRMLVQGLLLLICVGLFVLWLAFLLSVWEHFDVVATYGADYDLSFETLVPLHLWIDVWIVIVLIFQIITEKSKLRYLMFLAIVWFFGIILGFTVWFFAR